MLVYIILIKKLLLILQKMAKKMGKRLTCGMYLLAIKESGN